MRTHLVQITLPDIEAGNVREAAIAALAALVSADWSAGLQVRVKPEPGLFETVQLTGPEVFDALATGEAPAHG